AGSPPPPPQAGSKSDWKKKNGADTIHGALIDLITRTIKSDSWNQSGGQGTIDYYPLGGALIVNQTPDILDQVEILLNALRRMQELEVSVEIRLVTVADNFFERIGVDFSANILTNNHKYDQQLLSGQFANPGAI